MKVKELIKKLKKLNPELPVYICDEVEGNDGPLSDVEVHKDYNCYDGISSLPTTADIVMLRWN